MVVLKINLIKLIILVLQTVQRDALWTLILQGKQQVIYTGIPNVTTSSGLQALVKNSKRPPDCRFSNRHSPTQDLIAIDFINAAVPLQSFLKTILFTVLFQIGIKPKDNGCVKWCFLTDFIIDIALSMVLKFPFSHSRPSYKGKFYYGPTLFPDIAIMVSS